MSATNRTANGMVDAAANANATANGKADAAANAAPNGPHGKEDD